ncbi:MAG: formylglycine-generating enzyme family protein [Nitrospinota bacterium]
MVFVPPGPFLQGSAEGPYHEGPARQVVLDAFFIDLTEVSNEAYGRFRRATGNRAPRYASDAALNRPNQPVVGVDWFEAAAYCAWAGKRLPTEAEWEKAARGPEGRRYPWGEAFAPEKVNGLGASGGPEPVGGRPGGASPYGALHMAGNVWEWVADFYADHYYRRAPARNPLGPPSGFLRVIKGGSYRNGPEHLRAAVRFRLDPVVRWKSVGFRCARDAGPPGGRPWWERARRER